MTNWISKNKCQKNMPSRTEIVTAISNEVCRKADALKGGQIIKKGNRVVQYSGGYTNVFPFIDKNGKKVAVRCWCADIDNAQERCRHISEFLRHDQSNYFVNFNYVNDALLVAGTLQPVVIMDWVEGQTLKKYINDKKPSQQLFLDLAEKFLEMVKYLHRKNIAHGDLQHGNIMVKPDGTLVLIDYDSMYIESLGGMTDAIKGLPGYQHPARMRNRYLSAKADYFSELVIYLSLNIFAHDPELWNEYSDTEDLLFSKEDFSDLKHSGLYRKYHNCSVYQIDYLMNELLKMLSFDDIDKLPSIESVLNHQSSAQNCSDFQMEGILSKLNTPTASPSAPSKDSSADVESIIHKLDAMMDAIELSRRIPNLDVKQIINKFDY